MSDSTDLIALARELAGDSKGRGRPKAVRLKRALSCAYYAMFHGLARMCADSLIGSSKTDRAERAWQQVYRSLDHGPASQRCKEIGTQKTNPGFPTPIVTFATQFMPAKENRHRADYDPAFAPTKGTVLAAINAAEVALKGFDTATAKDRRALAVYVLLKRR